MCNLDKIPSQSALITDELAAQMKVLLDKMTKKVTLKAVLDCQEEKSLEMGAFLKAVASVSENLELELYEKEENPEVAEELNGAYLPVVGIYGEEYSGACFHGTPGGKEMNSFLAAICFCGGAAQPLDKKVLDRIAEIKKDTKIKIFVSLSCHHCPHVVAACQKIALSNSRVTAEMYDARLYPDIIEKYQIERVPMTIINDSRVVMGQKTIEEFTAILLQE